MIADDAEDRIMIIVLGIIIAAITCGMFKLIISMVHMSEKQFLNVLQTGIMLVGTLIGLIFVISLLWCIKYFSKMILNFINYKKFIYYDPNTFSKIKKGVNKIPFEKNGYKTSKDLKYYNVQTQELVEYSFIKSESIISKIKSDKMNIINAVKEYQKLDQLFYKVIGFNELIVNQKIKKLFEVQGYLKLNSGINALKESELMNLKDEQSLLTKQLEEMIELFNHKMMHENFKTKYLMMSNKQSKIINYKINEVL